MSVNKVILVGNVGRDPEIRYFDNGKAVANFSLATKERGYTTSNGIQVPDRTEWHNIVLYRGAEVAEKYIHKGSKIYIEGKIRTRSYDDGEGIKKRYITEVLVDTFELLDRKQLDSENKTLSCESSVVTNYTPQVTINPPIEQEDDDLPF